VKGELTQGEISKTVDFCFRAFQPVSREEREAVLKKIESLGINETTPTDAEEKAKQVGLEEALTADELRILNAIRARQMIRSEDTMNIDNFSFDTIEGLAPNLKRGDLGLVPSTTAPMRLPEGPEGDVLALMTGEKPKEATTDEKPEEAKVPISAY
jgi:flavine halogenase